MRGILHGHKTQAGPDVLSPGSYRPDAGLFQRLAALSTEPGRPDSLREASQELRRRDRRECWWHRENALSSCAQTLYRHGKRWPRAGETGLQDLPIDDLVDLDALALSVKASKWFDRTYLKK